RAAVRRVSSNALTQRIALAIPTRNIRAAAFRERPSSTTALITRTRRASPCAILAGLLPVARMNHASPDLGIPSDSIRPQPALVAEVCVTVRHILHLDTGTVGSTKIP